MDMLTLAAFLLPCLVMCYLTVAVMIRAARELRQQKEAEAALSAELARVDAMFREAVKRVGEERR